MPHFVCRAGAGTIFASRIGLGSVTTHRLRPPSPCLSPPRWPSSNLRIFSCAQNDVSSVGHRAPRTHHVDAFTPALTSFSSSTPLLRLELRGRRCAHVLNTCKREGTMRSTPGDHQWAAFQLLDRVQYVSRPWYAVNGDETCRAQRKPSLLLD